MKATSIILAGGKNVRFGRIKALEVIGGKRLIDRVIERLKPLSSQILVVTSREQFDRLVIHQAEVLVDLYPEKGPLGGIYTGLVVSRSSHSIVVACDLPFLNAGLLRYMIELADDYDAVVPRLREGKMETLHAIYTRSCLESMQKRLQRDQLGVSSFLRTVRVKYIGRAECQRLDPELLSFFNINYQRDLERAVALAAKLDADRGG